MSTAPPPCPPSDVLEGIALGNAVPPPWRAHLDQCDACRLALQRMVEDNRFLSGFLISGAWPTVPLPRMITEIDIPGYQVIREIHRGGQGVVYQALQLSTKRDVAVKVMKQGPFATLADRVRFDREVETLGKLKHPNIVAVHDAGAVAGFQYFVMNYVDGQPLDEAFPGLGCLIPERASTDGPRPGAGAKAAAAVRPSPLQVASALQAFIKVCDAVHAAHLRGVIHRDLKPSNIRVDRSGEPHVLDFGLAKSADALPDSAMTRTGQFVGSLPWASPEQVEGASQKIDLRTDVYALGAILFQLLTGSLPFDAGSNLRDAVDSILYRAPPRPSTLAAAAGGPPIDDELETIVLKCLAKDRERRYQSAGELARDLQRYLAGEPIDAKRESTMYLLRKTLRRYRLRVAAAAAFVILLGVFGAVMAVLYRHTAVLEQDARRSAASLSDLLSLSNLEQGRMAGLLGNLEQAEALVWRELLTRRPPGVPNAVTVNDPPGPPEAYWALWELYRRHPCLRTLTPQPEAVRAVTVADDGTGLWTADCDGFVQRLDAFGNRRDSYRVAVSKALGIPSISASGQTVLYFTGAHYAVWRRAAGDGPLLELPTRADLESIILSYSGRRLAALIGGEAIVWNLEPVAELGRFRSPDADLGGVALAHDDRHLAARDRFGGLHLWDLETRQPVVSVRAAAPLRETLHSAGELLFSADDQWLADAWLEIPGRVWNLSVDPPTSVTLADSPGDFRVQSFSPDGSLLAVGDRGGALRVFNVRTGERLTTLVAHPGRVRCVAFTGDGRGIWTCGDHDLRLWELPPDSGVHVVRIDGELFHGVAISPDGSWLLASGRLGVLHRVELATLASSPLAFRNEATVSCVAISPDGRRTAATTYANAAYVWDTGHPDAPPVRLAHPNRVSHAAFSSDSTTLATACDDGTVRIWDAAAGRLERELRCGDDRVPEVAFDPTGRRLAAALRNGALLVWDLQTAQCETWVSATHSPLRTAQYSPDGRWLLAAGADREIGVWDASVGRRVATLVGHNQEVYCLAFSSNGELVATGDAGGTIRLWHATLRRPLATLDGHTGPVMALHFAADGRVLVSASLDGALRVWDLTYYARHIAGNVATQLHHARADEADRLQADAWRRWARSVAEPPSGARTGGTPPQ
jgi:eukaryotic-like serine/threonine-protein kinase